MESKNFEITTAIETKEDPNKVRQENCAQIRELLMMIYRRGKNEVSWQEDLQFMTQEEKDEEDEQSIANVLHFVNDLTRPNLLESVLDSSVERILITIDRIGEEAMSEKMNNYFKNMLEEKKKEKELEDQLLRDIQNMNTNMSENFDKI